MDTPDDVERRLRQTLHSHFDVTDEVKPSHRPPSPHYSQHRPLPSPNSHPHPSFPSPSHVLTADIARSRPPTTLSRCRWRVARRRISPWSSASTPPCWERRTWFAQSTSESLTTSIEGTVGRRRAHLQSAQRAHKEGGHDQYQQSRESFHEMYNLVT